MNEEEIGKLTLDAAFTVPREFGPGLLESLYEAAMNVELRRLGLRGERQVPISVSYRGKIVEVGFRSDLIGERLGLVELKSVESVTPVFKEVTLTYLHMIPHKLGFLINFNESLLKSGITRIVNDLSESVYPSSRPSRDTAP